MKTINKFDFIERPEQDCTKCGGIGVSVEFIPKDITIAREGQEVQYLEISSERDREYLLCKCKTCGYMALTICKDNML